VLMREAGRNMDGLSLHYYTTLQGWPPSGSATVFDEASWHLTLAKALHMETLVERHATIMDLHDPAKRVGMIIDEWGTWFAVEPGTNPGFLYQQNTLRDALVAALHFHIFQRHADRVAMTNIAQFVNVLQAMLLTDGARLLRTPTYWVFEMFKVHQGGTVIPVDFQDSPAYVLGETSIPAVSASATRHPASGAVHLSLANTHPRETAGFACRLGGLSATSVTGRILTAPVMTAHNTFDAPDTLQPAPFAAARVTTDGRLEAELPPMSVIVLELR
jgi:alpha-N-arabinofuranosidase